MMLPAAGHFPVRFKGDERSGNSKNKPQTLSQSSNFATPAAAPSRKITEQDLVDLVMASDTEVNLLCDAVEKIGEQNTQEQRRDAFLWLKTLIKRADEKALNRKGVTGEKPLDVADRIKDWPAFRFLLQHGAKQMTNQDRPNQLLWKAPCWNQQQDWKKVIQLPAFHPNKQDKNGRTALMNAAVFAESELAERLLTFKDTDVNLKDRNGSTALIEAALSCQGRSQGKYPEDKQRIAFIEKLLQRKNINLNAQETQGGRTAIMFPAKKGNLEIVKLLAKQPGIDLDIETESGKTAFTEAGERGHLAIWKALWQARHPEEEEWIMDLDMPFDLIKRDRDNEKNVYH